MPAAITSAPGDPYLSCHIRDAGDWTHALYGYMTQYAKNVEVGVQVTHQLGTYFWFSREKIMCLPLSRHRSVHVLYMTPRAEHVEMRRSCLPRMSR